MIISAVVGAGVILSAIGSVFGIKFFRNRRLKTKANFTREEQKSEALIKAVKKIARHQNIHYTDEIVALDEFEFDEDKYAQLTLNARAEKGEIYMIKKLPKELLEKLTQDEINLISNVYDGEAKLIREATENKMIKKSDYDNVLSELNSFKFENELNNQLKDVDPKNKDIIKDLVGNDITKLDNVKEKYSHLFTLPDTPIEDIITNGFNGTEKSIDNEALKDKIINGNGTEKLVGSIAEVQLKKILTNALSNEFVFKATASARSIQDIAGVVTAVYRIANRKT
ncbi:hypothetical protein KPH14_012958 [Odynerus spinipes]|uniref:Uncharacterized protein n=1 Tax=Odynerus spinipes TaxID=1348599 RepID=A0AAD9R7W9_9HYME|nr:hypothetical protein KPH14_012958 [Odynerus spinipes]